MSPSEADLRAALRDGEGGGVDADVVIWAAKGIRARRQHRVLSAAAAVVIVAGAATGITALATSWGVNESGNAGGSGTSMVAGGGQAAGSASAPDLRHRQARVPYSAGLNANAPSAPSPSASVLDHCPARPKQYRAPATGGPDLGGARPILAAPATAFQVCAYTTSTATGTAPSAGRPGALAFTGRAAEQLAASLTGASRTPVGIPCPLIRTGSSTVTLVITPVTRSGATLRPIVASTSVPACNTEITNGVTVRYNWQFPSRLRSVLGIDVFAGQHGSSPVEITPSGSAGTVSGSPPR